MMFVPHSRLHAPLCGDDIQSTRGASDSLCSSIYGPRQPARLPFKVKLHVHVQEMLERLSGDFADGTLGYTGKEGVTELAKGGCEYSGRAVWPSA